MDEMFAAVKGGGVTLNGNNIKISRIEREKEIHTFCHGRDQASLELALKYYRHQKLNGFDCRQLGSAALELSFVAAGRLESIMIPGVKAWDVAAGPEPAADVRRDLDLAWTACKHGKSNAIVLVRGGATLGCGFGQMSRVDSVRLAVRKAADQGLDLQDAVAASDGFFPFPDGVEELARAGIRTVLAPGGSVRDQEVAAAARELGITLILASRRHFNH